MNNSMDILDQEGDGNVFNPLDDPKDGHILTRAIIDTIHEPLLVLDGTLRVVVASESFYKKFGLSPLETQGKFFYKLNDGEWGMGALRKLLEQVITEHKNLVAYEVTLNLPFLGRRTMTVNAREIRYENGRKKMLLSIFDITDQRELQAEREKLMVQKDLLLKEMRHRIANSLQLIASILTLKAEMVNSEESRAHLQDAHERIMSIAVVQQQLDPIGHGEDIAIAGYLNALCSSLARSMIGGRKPITLSVEANSGMVSSDTAISLGLLTTELVINALKHAFPDGRRGEIVVAYTINGSGWILSVRDDGVGKSRGKKDVVRTGLGTSIIGALANQLQALIRTRSSVRGTTVAIIHDEQI